MRWTWRHASLASALSLSWASCVPATTQYTPQVIARGELILRYHHGLEMWGGGRLVARPWQYAGLPQYVRCVPQALTEAQTATQMGRRAVILSIVGAGLAVASAGLLVGSAIDDGNQPGWLAAGILAIIASPVAVTLGRAYRLNADGHAVDALNFYNDTVGSLGATCDDRRYPPPVGPQNDGQHDDG